MLRISIHIALATICAALGSCQTPTSGQKEALQITRYVGTWGPVRVNNVQLDSVQARHRLILRVDTTYSCTFSLESFDLNDTTHFSSPFVGRWSPYLWESEAYVSGVGIFFIGNSNRFVAKWRTVVGNADDRKMSFYDFELGGPMRDIEWVLIR